MTLIKREDAKEAVACELHYKLGMDIEMAKGVASVIDAFPSAEAVQILKDGTLEVKVPNAQKVGRVLVMDTESHIGGGLFYPESADAVQGEEREDYELATEHMEHDAMYEPTYNSEDGSM